MTIDQGFVFTRTHSHQSHTVQVTLHEDETLDAVIEAFTDFLHACGFSHDTIKRTLGENP